MALLSLNQAIIGRGRFSIKYEHESCVLTVMLAYLKNVDVILLDIEGTTTSISFVKNVLFPYVRHHLTDYVQQNWGSNELMETIEVLRKQVDDDREKGMKDVVEILQLPESASSEEICSVRKSVIANVLWQMDLDRKTTGLKQLQGQMWRKGYGNGDIKAHVYGDVKPCLENWKKQGKKIYIYSSGSVEAQKLLFACTEYGNLLPYIDGHFDTNIGPKVESTSYEKIAETIGVKPENILFLTDVTKEVKASLDARMQTVIVIREGNAPLTPEWSNHLQIDTFDNLQLS